MAGERSYGDALIRTTLRGVWPSLPALTVGSVAVCAGAVAPVLVAPGVNPVAAIVAAVTVAPPAAALLASVNELAFGDDATIRTWWRALRSLWRHAIKSALAVAVAISLFLAAHEAVRATGSPWFWPSFAMTGAAAVLAVLALTAAMPLAAARPEMRGRALWLTALGCGGAPPDPLRRRRLGGRGRRLGGSGVDGITASPRPSAGGNRRRDRNLDLAHRPREGART